MARAIVNRLLHEPTLQMKEHQDDRVHARMAIIRDLFGLEGAEGVPAADRPRPPRAGARRGAPSSRRRRRRLIRVGTRGSALALAQAQWVAIALGGAFEIVDDHDVRRSGRRRRTSPAGSRSSSGRCSTAEIDVAVHSAKDVPAELADGLELAAIPPREDPHDALCGAPSLAEWRPARGWGRAACGARRRFVRCVTTWRCGAARERRHPATQARRRRVRRVGAGAGGAASGSAARSSGVPLERRPGGRAGRARARGAPAGRARSGRADRRHRRRRVACVAPSASWSPRWARPATPRSARYARVLADGQLELTGWVGLPDGRRGCATR